MLFFMFNVFNHYTLAYYTLTDWGIFVLLVLVQLAASLCKRGNGVHGGYWEAGVGDHFGLSDIEGIAYLASGGRGAFNHARRKDLFSN
ncbi:hypothetical protein [Paenibacillus elgii]|uniref:hypothetical protein n=1 Tax=Paenibacillus elgii TaxID=189691 RepID=UPI0013D83DBB|nr:hypothetical protein [Paenibacillus elgii]